MKRFSYWLAALMAVALIATACGGDDDGGDGSALTLVASGTLTVCTDSPYPPMEFEQDGEFTGFDIELMRAIAEDLGLELAVNNIGFDPITSGIAMESDECDIAAASITITDEREENIDFSDPYFTADQSLLVSTESGITDLAGFSGRSLAVQSATTGEAYAKANAPSDAAIVSFDNPGGLIGAPAQHLALSNPQVAQHGQVRKQVELLEHHPDAGTQPIDVRVFVGNVFAFDQDRS